MPSPPPNRSAPKHGGVGAALLGLAGLVSTAACMPREVAPARDPQQGGITLYNLEVGERGGMAAAEQTLSAMREAQVRISMVLAQALSLGATLWVVNHGSCPTPEEIVHERLVSEMVSPQDAWENPYRIECGGPGHDEPTVTSAGPDGVFDTIDDIIAGTNATGR
jgi:hypothetical protein